MAEPNERPYIWRNICTLMGMADPSLDKVAAHTGVGRGSLQRIRDGSASPQLSTLEAIARKFGLSVWQLLVPDISRDAPPKLAVTQQEELRAIAKAEARAAVSELMDGNAVQVNAKPQALLRKRPAAGAR